MGAFRAGFLTLVVLSLLTAAVMMGLSQPAAPAEPAPSSTPAAQESTTSESNAVRMSNMLFAAADISVPVGATVTWTNDDAMGHTVTPVDPEQWGSQGSGNAPADWLQKDGTWEFTFTKEGVYEYYCLPHAAKGSDGKYRGMVGVVRVGAAGGAPASPATNAASVPETTVVPSPVVPARTLPGPDGIVHLELETVEVLAQIADGTAYEFWTFNNTVPGPMLRVREGDTVQLTLKNDISSLHPHSIDLHAVTGPGGGAVVTQTAPGDATRFTFKALNPGLYVYHCASPHIPTHVANGMYGLILVEPEEGLPPVDREYFVVQGEVYTEGRVGEKGVQAFSMDKMLDERAEYYLLNGRVGALTGEGALKAEVNETVRIYFAVGGFVPSSFHVIGEIFDRVYSEGAMSAPAENVQTTLVPAGGATIVEFKVEVPGTYLLVDHWLTHAIDRGAAGALVVTGPEDHAVFHGTPTAGSGH